MSKTIIVRVPEIKVVTAGVQGPQGPQGPAAPLTKYEMFASLTQSGASAPVMTVGFNNIPQGIGTWSYIFPGIYIYTLNDAFPAGKTFPGIVADGSTGGVIVTTRRQSPNAISVTAFDAVGNVNANGCLNAATFWITITL